MYTPWRDTHILTQLEGICKKKISWIAFFNSAPMSGYDIHFGYYGHNGHYGYYVQKGIYDNMG